MAEIKNKSAYKLIDTETNKEYQLYVTHDYEMGFDRSIIINEAATGDDGYTYDNGRKQESIPINGTLIGKDRIDVNNKKNEIYALQGKIVEFITPYSFSNLRTNKFFIQSASFRVVEGSNRELGFSMTLQEKRDVNIKQTQVNMVNFEPASAMREIYNQRIGNE